MTTERTQTEWTQVVRIGTLSFAHPHAHAYAAALAAHPSVEFVGIADPDSERGQAAAQSFGTTYYASATELLAQTLASYNATGVSWPGWGSSADTGLVDDFVRHATGKAAPDLATGEDGLAALAVALAAYESAKTGQPEAVRL